MTSSATTTTKPRTIVVVVGPQSKARTDATARFIDEGNSVVICAGPPGCALLREEPCVLVDVADAVVLMPRAAGNRQVEAGLSMCAKAARCAVVIDGSSTASWPAEAIQVRVDDLDGVARGLSTART